MADDVVRIKYGVSMRAINNSTRQDVYEIPRAEWEAMGPEDREALLNEISQTMLDNEVETWAYVDEES
jgi:hypothetical protein